MLMLNRSPYELGAFNLKGNRLLTRRIREGAKLYYLAWCAYDDDEAWAASSKDVGKQAALAVRNGSAFSLFPWRGDGSVTVDLMYDFDLRLSTTFMFMDPRNGSRVFAKDDEHLTLHCEGPLVGYIVECDAPYTTVRVARPGEPPNGRRM